MGGINVDAVKICCSGKNLAYDGFSLTWYVLRITDWTVGPGGIRDGTSSLRRIQSVLFYEESLLELHG